MTDESGAGCSGHAMQQRGAGSRQVASTRHARYGLVLLIALTGLSGLYTGTGLAAASVPAAGAAVVPAPPRQMDITAVRHAAGGKMQTLDAAARREWLQRLPKSLTMIRDYLADEDIAWQLHRGDLHIDASFDNGAALIVDGDLHISGDYDDYGSGIGLLIVLGDMRAGNLVSWGSVAVSGDLTVAGLVYAYYNDFTFEVAGTLKARALVVSDRSFSAGRIDAGIHAGDNGDDYPLVLRHMVPELLISDVLDHGEGEPVQALPDYSLTRRRLLAGLPLFRSTPAPASLPADLELALDSGTPAHALKTLAGRDLLLAAAVAPRPDLPAEVQAELVRQASPPVMELLAANPRVVPDLLPAIAAASAEAAALAVQHPQAPAALAQSLVASADPARREAALQQLSLPAALVNKLAADAHTGVRLAVLQSDQTAKLTPASLDALIRDADPAVRRAVLNLHGRLQARHYPLLAADPDHAVREALADDLSQQALYAKPSVLAVAEREALARTLAGDREPGVRLAAVPALAAGEQLALVDRLKGRDAQLLGHRLARSTRSPEVMRHYIRADQALREELAGNLALPSGLQLQLLDALPRPATRARPSRLDTEAWNQLADGPDAVVEALMQNPNTTDAVLMKVADYCAAIDGLAGFCGSLLDRAHLPLAVLERLKAQGDSSFRDDFVLTVLGQSASSRALLEYAWPRWHDDDPELQQAFADLRRHQGADWWQALAASSHTALRELAAGNRHTPADALRRLARDPVEDVVARVAGNPACPDELWPLLQAHRSWLQSNPRWPESRLQELLQQAEASNDELARDYVREVLAARALRAPAQPGS